MSLTDVTVIGKWVAWLELAVGFAMLTMGLRTRGRPGELIAPVGAMMVLTGLFRVFGDAVPAGILIPIGFAAFAATAVWFVLTYRASRARMREMVKQREQASARDARAAH